MHTWMAESLVDSEKGQTDEKKSEQNEQNEKQTPDVSKEEEEKELERWCCFWICTCYIHFLWALSPYVLSTPFIGKKQKKND